MSTTYHVETRCQVGKITYRVRLCAARWSGSVVHMTNNKDIDRFDEGEATGYARGFRDGKEEGIEKGREMGFEEGLRAAEMTAMRQQNG